MLDDDAWCVDDDDDDYAVCLYLEGRLLCGG